MDRDQHELQFLGFLGVYREASKIILKWRRIFAQITLALILPLCVVFLAHSAVSQLLFFEIAYNDLDRGNTTLKKEWVAFWLLQLGCFIFVFIFSLLSTSAVAYTVACIYVAKQINFKNIMSVVPRVWKRLMVTFLWSFAAFVAFVGMAGRLLVRWVVIVETRVGLGIGIAMLVILLILFAVGLVCMTMIWQLASVISVLEDVYGKKAIAKSGGLIEGKMGLSVWCFLGVLVWFTLVQALFECFVVFGFYGIGIKIGVGLICLFLLLMVVIFYLVVQTVIYFVCKSYHHENIDESLSDHLEVSPGNCPSKA